MHDKTPFQLTEQTIGCPYCGESIDILIDPEDLYESYIEDCQVCCRPITMKVMTDGAEELWVEVFSENESF